MFFSAILYTHHLHHPHHPKPECCVIHTYYMHCVCWHLFAFRLMGLALNFSPFFMSAFLSYILTCEMLWNILVLIIYGKSAVNKPTLTGILVGCSRCHFLDIAKENGNGVIWNFIFDISTVHFSYFW